MTTDRPDTAIFRAALAALQQDLPNHGALFTCHGQLIGWLDRRRAEIAVAMLADARLTDQPVALHGRAAAATLDWRPRGDPSTALQRAAKQLYGRGLLLDWRNEAHSRANADGSDSDAEPLITIERSAFRFFGLRSRAVHINGVTADGRVWLAQRADHKAIDPGLWDNLAAGGVAAGESARACAVRELQEEAGVSAEQAAALIATTPLLAAREEPDGWMEQSLFVYQLPLAEDFVPRNRDGEVSDFILCDRSGSLNLLARRALTTDTAAVLAQFFLTNQHAI